MTARSRCTALVVSMLVGSGLGLGTISPAVAGRPSATTSQTVPTQSSDQFVKNAVANIQDYWAQTLPEVYGRRYQPIPDGNIQPYGSGTDVARLSKCLQGATYRDVAGNAFFCPLDNTVNYDNEQLFPKLDRQFGPLVLGLVLAHEWGHVIQQQTNTTFDNTVYAETQADCFAGAWAAQVNKTGGKELHIAAGDLDKAMAGMIQFRDPLGGDPTQQGAHGSGFDRVNAFQLGYDGGAQRCAKWDTDPPEITEIPFTNPQDFVNQGNAPFDEIVPDTKKDLDDYWSQQVRDYKTPKTTSYATSKPPKCPSLDKSRRQLASTVFYCPDTNTVAYDEAFLRRVYGDIGDFGVATLMGNAWASAVQHGLGTKGDRRQLELHADCLNGSWVGGIPIDLPPTTTARGTPVDRKTVFSLSPGDLDEVVQSFLIFGRQPGQQSGRASSFDRARAFRTGFFSGESACSTVGGSTSSTSSTSTTGA